MANKFKVSAFLISTFLLGCAHGVDPVKISNQADAGTEIANQRELLVQARQEQVDVLGAADFKRSEDRLAKAQTKFDIGSNFENVLSEVAYSKAYLNRAYETANQVRYSIPGVVEARSAAIKAGARNHSTELNLLDTDLKRVLASSTANDLVKIEEKKGIQNKYLDLELVAIKSSRLTATQGVLNEARKRNAEKLTPNAYALALQKLNTAEKLIEVDRHNDYQIDLAVKSANESATRLLALSGTAGDIRNNTPEQNALILESQSKALQQADAVTYAAQSESLQKDAVLEEKDAKLEAIERENQRLKRKERNEKKIADAASMLEEKEAEVYRQEGKVIIRLKTMNFPVNSADLPADSMNVLTKVKEVIKEIGPAQILVEGHTDAVGNAVVNQQLSKKRAESVAKFFAADSVLGKDHFEYVGYGYSKPLTTNKTPQGRAQNRRVDVVIKPAAL